MRNNHIFQDHRMGFEAILGSSFRKQIADYGDNDQEAADFTEASYQQIRYLTKESSQKIRRLECT